MNYFFVFPLLGAFPAPPSGFDFTCPADCGKGNASQGNPVKSYGIPKMFFAEGCRQILSD